MGYPYVSTASMLAPSPDWYDLLLSDLGAHPTRAGVADTFNRTSPLELVRVSVTRVHRAGVDQSSTGKGAYNVAALERPIAALHTCTCLQVYRPRQRGSL